MILAEICMIKKSVLLIELSVLFFFGKNILILPDCSNEVILFDKKILEIQESQE